MHKTIGVKNFRVFKNYTEFEFRPITLLTGPNNSGKSSLTKFLLLLQNDLEQLNFEDGEHNLESFEKILNWESSNEELLIRFSNKLNFLPDHSYTEFEFSKGELKTVRFASSEITYLEIDFSTDLSAAEFGSIGFIQQVNLNVQALRELFIDKTLIIKSVEDRKTGPHSSKSITNHISLREFINSNSYLTEIHFNNLTDHLKNLQTFQFKKAYSYRNSAIINEINQAQTIPFIFEVLINGEQPDPVKLERIRKIQNEVFSSLSFAKNAGMSLKLKNFKMNFDYLLDQIPLKAEKIFKKKMETYFENEKIEINRTIWYDLFFSKALFVDSLEKFSSHPFEEGFDDQIKFHQTLLEQFKNLEFKLKNFLGHFSFISPNRGKQQRVLMNKSDYEIDKIILEYSQLHKTQQKLEFLSKALKLLGIEGELNVERHENYISVVSLIQKNQQTTLADLGFGYSQIIPIILKIILTAARSGKDEYLIIEEPEANLHPNLQSKFADILKLSIKEFSDIKFIIETHSEYLIRKLQYLTGKKELDPNQSVIYYFNADKFVSKEEPKVKKIEITPTGNLTDTFGPGFYDEATRLKFDLMKLNKEQSN